MSSSSSGDLFRRPQSLQLTSARTPRRAAPPTPTTTPMMMFLFFVLKPPLSASPSELPSRGVVVTVLVLTATSALVVSTCDMVLLPLTVTMVVTTCWVALETEMDVVTTTSLDDVVDG